MLAVCWADDKRENLHSHAYPGGRPAVAAVREKTYAVFWYVLVHCRSS